MDVSDLLDIPEEFLCRLLYSIFIVCLSYIYPIFIVCYSMGEGKERVFVK